MKRNISFYEIKGRDLEEYAECNPNVTLAEYIESIRDRLDKENEDEKLRQENELQWYKDNLVGKNILFRMNGGYDVLKVKYDEIYNQIYFQKLYYFTTPGRIDNSGETSRRFIFQKITSAEGRFNQDRIKNPYNNYEYQKNYAYIISDEKLEEIKNLFETFIKGYDELLNFEKSDYVIKAK